MEAAMVSVRPVPVPHHDARRWQHPKMCAAQFLRFIGLEWFSHRETMSLTNGLKKVNNFALILIQVDVVPRSPS
ncbi:MAG: hypothetical protein MZV65_48740 [Chromatiales bacterium]|nr:hypothetical protein [Chromatiales bacterium]